MDAIFQYRNVQKLLLHKNLDAQVFYLFKYSICNPRQVLIFPISFTSILFIQILDL